MRVLRTGLATRLTARDQDVPLLGKVTDLYFQGDMQASVANTGRVSSRIADLPPVSEIVRRTWLDIEAALNSGPMPDVIVHEMHIAEMRLYAAAQQIP